jgi:hypothetical protein
MMQAATPIHLIPMVINLGINNPSVLTKTRNISLQKEITAEVIVDQATTLNQVWQGYLHNVNAAEPILHQVS